MSVGSVSFWQQDQAYWSRTQRNDQTQTLSAAVISGMFNATSTLSTGLSSIANQTALDRTNNQLTAAVQSALQSINGDSSASSSAASGSSTSATTTSAATPVTLASPAVGTGTAPLTTGTALFTLGILKGGQITVSAGGNMTTYNSTGTDTVGDLINAINSNAHGNANVAAGLDNRGKLVITGRNTTDTITVGGIYAANIGFGAGNTSFQPIAASSPAGASTTSSAAGSSGSSGTGSSTSAASGGTSTSSTSSSGGTSSKIPANSAIALQTVGTAELLLASGGVAGSLLNMLA